MNVDGLELSLAYCEGHFSDHLRRWVIPNIGRQLRKQGKAAPSQNYKEPLLYQLSNVTGGCESHVKMRRHWEDRMSGERVTDFTAVDSTKDPQFFSRFLDAANRNPTVVASKPIILEGLRV